MTYAVSQTATGMASAETLGVNVIHGTEEVTVSTTASQVVQRATGQMQISALRVCMMQLSRIMVLAYASTTIHL
jgi:hypothetical protein